MIRKILIENFYSIKEVQVLDLNIPSNAPDLPKFGLQKEISDIRVPKVVAIFGANASGKTTVLRALSFLHWFLTRSFNTPPTDNLIIFPFADEDSQNSITRFEVEFDSNIVKEHNPCIYKYSLELEYSDKSKLSDKLQLNPIVKSESLHYSPLGKFRRLFERDYDEIKGSDEFKVRIKDYPPRTFRENVSVIPTLAQYAHPVASELVSSLNSVQTNINLLQKYDFDIDNIIRYYSSNLGVLSKLNNKIRMLDFGIDEVVIRNDTGTQPSPFFRHAGLSKELIFATESQGTQKFFTIFPFLNFVLETGGVAILDEIDNDIHPMLMPEIISWFHNHDSNPHNAQLIIACHNASLLEGLEKEEVFFAEKDSCGRTSVYGLKDILGVRRIDNYYKKYLGGVFGAVPNIG